jgi:DNA-binding MarR family transcriptional regulator
MDIRYYDDAVARLGYLALGTRLKRLGDQLQMGVAEAIARLGGAIQPAQMVLLVTIDADDGPTIANLVQSIGVSQPAISRSLGALQKAGFVNLTIDDGDGRMRRVRLTDKGRRILAEIHQQLFPKVAIAAEQLCDGLDLLDRLGIAERRLREQPFGKRIEDAGT